MKQSTCCVMVAMVTCLLHIVSSQIMLIIAEVGKEAKFLLPRSCLDHDYILVQAADDNKVAKFSSYGSRFYRGGRLSDGCYEWSDEKCVFYMPVRQITDKGRYHFIGSRPLPDVCRVTYLLEVYSGQPESHIPDGINSNRQKGQPYTISGKVNGSLNSLPLENTYLLAYVDPDEGRFFISFNFSTQSIARLLILVTAQICEFLGWIFTAYDFSNYTGQTGISYSKTAVIQYKRGYSVELYQNFSTGLRQDEYIMDTHISGTLPPIVENVSSIHVENYQVNYGHKSGRIDSLSISTIEWGSRIYQVSVNQSINCSSKKSPLKGSTLKVSNVYVGFLKRNKTITLSMEAEFIKDPDSNSDRAPNGPEKGKTQVPYLGFTITKVATILIAILIPILITLLFVYLLFCRSNKKGGQVVSSTNTEYHGYAEILDNYDSNSVTTSEGYHYETIPFSEAGESRVEDSGLTELGDAAYIIPVYCSKDEFISPVGPNKEAHIIPLNQLKHDYVTPVYQQDESDVFHVSPTKQRNDKCVGHSTTNEAELTDLNKDLQIFESATSETQGSIESETNVKVIIEHAHTNIDDINGPDTETETGVKEFYGETYPNPAEAGAYFNHRICHHQQQKTRPNVYVELNTKK